MPTQSQDALEVAEVLGNKLRPMYVFVSIVFAVVGVGVERLWSLSDFIHRDVIHEKQQDDNQLVMQKRLNEHEAGIKAARERNLDVVKLLLNDLALLRSIQLQTLPARKRDYVRKQFEAQRMQGIDLLVKVQK